MLIRDIVDMKGGAIVSIAPEGKVSDAVRMMVNSFHDLAKSVIRETSFVNRLLKRYIRNWPEEESAK